VSGRRGFGRAAGCGNFRWPGRIGPFFEIGCIMSLSADDVAKIAHLARLGIDPETAGPLGRELQNILDLVASMDRVDTAGVAPMAHPLDMAQRLRPDEVTEVDRREVYQANAPAVEDGLFLVPRVIE
jgi:aspartyl-tRNA(Asn)/glutamyl-tRNA(Gln) amidotransferase subunit C